MGFGNTIPIKEQKGGTIKVITLVLEEGVNYAIR